MFVSPWNIARARTSWSTQYFQRIKPRNICSAGRNNWTNPYPLLRQPLYVQESCLSDNENSILHFLGWLFLSRCNRRTFTVVTYRQVYISLINWTTIGIGILKGKIYVTNRGSDNIYSRVNVDTCKCKINFSDARTSWLWYSIMECQASNSFCFT